MVQGMPSSLSGVPNAASLPQSAASPATAVSQGTASPGAAPGPPQGEAPMGSPHPSQEPPHQKQQEQHPPGKLHHASRSSRSAPARVIGPAHKGLLIALAGLVVIGAGGIVLALVHKGGGGTPSRPGTITAFSVPTSGSTLSAITAGPDGNVWFTEYHGNKIGRITPGGTLTEFPLPTGTSGFEGSTAGPSGMKPRHGWFTNPGSEDDR